MGVRDGSSYLIIILALSAGVVEGVPGAAGGVTHADEGAERVVTALRLSHSTVSPVSAGSNRQHLQAVVSSHQALVDVLAVAVLLLEARRAAALLPVTVAQLHAVHQMP